MRDKCILVIIGILIIISTLIVILAKLQFGLFLLPNPHKPEITYGEFPFKLTYELNGEIKIIEDTVICEFDGFDKSTVAGRYRKWKGSLKSGKDKIILFKDKNKTFYFYYGDPENYMGDNQRGRYGSDLYYDLSTIDYIEKLSDDEKYGSISAVDMWNEYKFKIISWDYTRPIQNNFK